MQIIPLTSESAPHLISLFPENPPVPTRLWAMLDGTIQGRLLVDDPQRPTWALVQDLSEGHVYLGGALRESTLLAAFDCLRRYQELVVCLWPGDPLLSRLPPGHTYEGAAIDFSERSPSVELDRLAGIPEGYDMRRIDKAYAASVAGFAYYLTMFGGIEPAVENLIGYYLLRGDEVACEAAAAPLTRGVAELGVETSEALRGQGLATALCAYVMRECEGRGYRAFWNAAQQYTASVALARRLGFLKEQAFTVMAWPATSPAPDSL